MLLDQNNLHLKIIKAIKNINYRSFLRNLDRFGEIKIELDDHKELMMEEEE